MGDKREWMAQLKECNKFLRSIPQKLKLTLRKWTWKSQSQLLSLFSNPVAACPLEQIDFDTIKWDNVWNGGKKILKIKNKNKKEARVGKGDVIT